MRKTLITLFAFALFAGNKIYADDSLQIPSPKPNSLVHDFANVIPDSIEQQLDAKLKKYEKETSIELAVVTVDSLQSTSVEDYTQALFRAWGVGKKSQNNGVVLLVAPNERKMRIEVGYGLEPDLTDGTAGQIIQHQIIPLFKEGKMADGIVAGADSIIAELGSKPYSQRVLERKAEEERAAKAAADEKIREEKAAEERARSAAVFWGVVKVMALPAIALVVLGLFIYSRVRKQQKIKEAPKLLESTRKEFADVKKEVDDPGVSADAKSELRQAQAELAKAESAAGKNTVDWLLVYALCASAGSYLSSAKTTAESDLEELAEAKRDSASLLRQIPGLIERAEKRAKKDGVSKRLLNDVNRAKEKYKDAASRAKSDPVNWITLAALLLAIKELLEDTHEEAVSQRQNYVSRNDDDDYRGGSGYSGGISFGGGSSGGDSGGGGGFSFGGGSSGGGGASGSW